MGQASSFVFDAVENAVHRYVTEKAELKTEGVPHGKECGADQGQFPDFSTSQKEYTKLLLTLSDVRSIALLLPECLSGIDLHHLSLLFVLDGDRDGMFSLSDLRKFINWALLAIPDETALDDLTETLKGRAVLRCWYTCHLESQNYCGDAAEAVCLHNSSDTDGHGSLEYFARWVLRLLGRMEGNTLSSSSTPPASPTVRIINEYAKMVHIESFVFTEEPMCEAFISPSRSGDQPGVGAGSGSYLYSDVYQDPPLPPPDFDSANMPTASPRTPLLSPQNEGWNNSKKLANAANSPRQVISRGALEELYQALRVVENCEFSFLSFSQLLATHNAAELEHVATARGDGTHVREVGLEAYVNQTAQPVDSTSTEVKSIFSSCVSAKVVENFMFCFCRAYWGTLRSLGLRP
ncbi:uncharacterized protein Tco025E_08538, partial [Trypanosoma conorhini]